LKKVTILLWPMMIQWQWLLLTIEEIQEVISILVWKPNIFNDIVEELTIRNDIFIDIDEYMKKTNQYNINDIINIFSDDSCISIID